MTICFFRREPGLRFDAPSLPQGASLRVWTPSQRPKSAQSFAVWLQNRLGLFADDRFAELSLWHGDEVVHRLIVTPRWHRFPFMERGDLQLGGLWTHSAHRRRGFALAAMNEAHRRFGGPGQRFWYVAEANNLSSGALARAAGYTQVGTGRRTSPAGIRLLGQFKLDQPAATQPRQPIPTGY